MSTLVIWDTTASSLFPMLQTFKTFFHLRDPLPRFPPYPCALCLCHPTCRLRRALCLYPLLFAPIPARFASVPAITASSFRAVPLQARSRHWQCAPSFSRSYLRSLAH
eukprot:4985737-Pleurochrysis_carterae.AAC.1